MRITKKLYTGFAIVILFAIIVGLVGAIGMQRLNTSGLAMYEKQVVGIENAGRAISIFDQLRIKCRTVVINSLYDDKKGALDAWEQFKIGVEGFRDCMERCNERADTEELLAFNEHITDLFENTYLPIAEQIIEKSINDIPDHNNRLHINVMLAHINDISDHIMSLMTGMMELNVAIAKQTSAENAAIAQWFIVAQIVLLAAAIIFTITITSAILRSEKELIVAREIAERSSRAKSDFLSNMSHEMRTPMNAIIGMIGIVKKSMDAERKTHALNKMEEVSGHLLGIINDVLDLSKIEADKLELASVSFDLTKLQQKAASFIQFPVAEKQIAFSIDIEDNVPLQLIGDEQRLTQVITNLLSNAVKFTPENGTISLKIKSRNAENGLCELQFEVADNGIGISPEQQARIFVAFEQAESGTSRQYGGTGLGLALSKRIVELMGGKISVDSEIGKGSKFTFTVKLTPDTENTQNQLHPLDLSECGTESIDGEFAGKRLLLAEDIEVNREILIFMLEDTGIAIDVAENGREAVEMIEAAPDAYDLVFMDIQMPHMDGFEATRRIRALLSTRERKLPIIAMTANVFKEDVENCYAAGMDDHVGKPVMMEIVLEKLRKYL